MKFKPAVVLSVYTGYLMCDFSEMHSYIEHVMGGPVWTHELASKELGDTIRTKIKENGDFAKAAELLNTL